MCYSAYLYHNFAIGLCLLPLYSLLQGYLPPAWEVFALALLLLLPVFAVTAVMFILVERPFMQASRHAATPAPLPHSADSPPAPAEARIPL